MGAGWEIDDGIDAWAQQLTPEAFAAPTTAFVVTPELEGLTGEVAGPAGDARFRAWVDQRLDDALAARGWAGPPAWTLFASDGRVQRRYDDCGCRRIECVLGVAGELRGIEEPWLVAVMLQKRPASPGPWSDPSLPRRWYAGWYAEARGRGVASRLAGWVQLRGDHQLDGFACQVEQLNEARRFQHLLRGHPARRRHPIRTRNAS